MISFHFACNSAGTPKLDNFYFQNDSRVRPQLAPEPFVSALAQAMLGHPRGGSLAFVGHVDRTWLSTFLWRSYGGKPHVYADVIEALLRGYRIGTALHLLSQVTAEISIDFVRKILEHTGPYDPKRTAVKMLGQISDLQGFVILGDPAVRLATASGD